MDIPADILTPLGVFDFIRGVFNGTTILSTPKMQLCEKSVTNVINGMTNVFLNGTAGSIIDVLIKFDSLILTAYSLSGVNS